MSTSGPNPPRRFDIGCTVSVSHTFENLSAHVEIDGDLPIEPGDRIHIHGRAIHPLRRGADRAAHRHRHSRRLLSAAVDTRDRHSAVPLSPSKSASAIGGLYDDLSCPSHSGSRHAACRVHPQCHHHAGAADHDPEPALYTTDIAALDRLSIEPVRAEWDELLADLAADNNRRHFVRGDDWDVNTDQITGELRKRVHRLPRQLADRRVFPAACSTPRSASAAATRILATCLAHEPR